MPLGAFRINSLAKFTVVAAGEVIRAKKGVAAIGDAKISTAQSVFGGSSAEFVSSGRLNVFPSATLTDEFTVECRFRPTSVSGFRMIIAVGNEINGRLSLELDGSSLLVGLRGTGAIISSSSGAITTNTWYYAAIVKRQGVITLYLNGNSIGTSTNSSTLGNSNGYYIGQTSGSTSSFSGFIDEVRVSNTARYTANFTPSTTQFVNDANTVLLLHMDGTNNSTVFEDDTGVRRKVAVRAIADAKISTAQSQFGGSSAIFDGTGDYLEIPNSATAIGTGPFTIDYWFRATSTASTPSLVDLRFGGGDTTGYSDYINSTGKLVVFMNNGNRITSTTTISTNTWYHVAIVRDSSNDIKMYINGTNEGSAYNFSNNMTSTYYRIGNNVSASNGFNGHIDELRISNVARYTANFTPSTAPFVNDANTRLLLHMDGTNNSTYFEDDTGVRAPVGLSATSTVVTSTTQSKFGGTSAYFNGAGSDHIFTGTEAPNLGSGNFTVEFWIYPYTNSAGNSNGVVTKRVVGNVGAGAWGVRWADSGTRTVVWENIINPVTTITSSANPFNYNAWSHWAFVRNGSTLTIYVNGTNVGSGSNSIDFTNVNPYRIGWWGTGTTTIGAYVDELRISNTARYTANFTAPTTPFVNDANTLLLIHCDGTNNSTVFIDDNGVTPDWNYTA